MRTAAVLIIDGANESSNFAESRHAAPIAILHADSGTTPLSVRRFLLMDFLGTTVLQRVVNRLRKFGVGPIRLLGGSHDPADMDSSDPSLGDLQEVAKNLPPAAERLFLQFAQQEVDTVFLIRLGAYTELDFSDLLKFHREKGQPATCVQGVHGSLHISVMDLAKGPRWEDVLGCVLREDPQPGPPYKFHGYVNPMASAYDYRRLAQDALAGRCDLKPVGNELRPGVWVGDCAAIDRRARILAPAYIGPHAEIMAAALVTRGSAIEHHCKVDCGTVVDDSSVLPYTYLGPGLEVTHAVVDGNRLLHLARNLELEIADRRLIGRTRYSRGCIRTRSNPLKDKATIDIRDLVAPTQAAEAASLHRVGEIAPSS